MTKPVEPRERMDIEAILGLGATAGAGWLRSRELRWAAAAVAGLVFVALVWSFNRGKTAVSYITEPATRGSLVVFVTATGSVQPLNKVAVSSELSGTVRKVLVDYNTVVTADQTLAELDTDKLKATADSSRAKLAAAKAKVADAEATIVEKQRELARKKGAIGQESHLGA